MRSWRDFIAGLILGAICLAAALFCYFRFGFAPVSTRANPMPLERYLASADLQVHVKAASAVQSPIPASEDNLLAAARTYRARCAMCHSLPGYGKTIIEQGMYPPPPELLTGKGVTDDPIGRTHWVVQNGIRMTGMPSFQGTLSDQQLWQVSLLLSRAHQLPQSVEELLRQPDTTEVAGP
ncbi:MAG TPA: cytochrome c [Bryobacteraceae bacterium]|nr:cytochrome c [Bryobacteraceae bacterium]